MERVEEHREWQFAGAKLTCPRCHGTRFAREHHETPLRHGFFGWKGSRKTQKFSCGECGYLLWQLMRKP